MAKDPILPLYYNDITRSTITWTDEEFGAYMRLLIEQWDKGCLPNDVSRLSRIATSLQNTWELIKSKFKPVDCGLQNPIMEEIRLKRIKHKNYQKENGKLGGRPKKETQIKPKLNLNNNLDESQTITQTESQIKPKKKPLENENEIYIITNNISINDEKEFQFFVEVFNLITGKNCKPIKKAKDQYLARKKDGFTIDDLEKAIINCNNDPYHKQNRKYLTPEFITRSDKLEMYLNANPAEVKKEIKAPSMADNDNIFTS
jgi:uncharacterized phage protein (TIGR02220 family)